MSDLIPSSLAEREKTNSDARIPVKDFFMTDGELCPSHTSIQIHTDFFEYPVSEVVGLADEIESSLHLINESLNEWGVAVT